MKIIPDTNIFLHFKMIDEIDWENIFPDESNEIVILPSVYREINHRKDSVPKNRISTRASDVLKKLLKIYETTGNVRAGIPLYLFDIENDTDWESLKLSPNSPDDKIVAEAIHYRSLNENENISIITSDNGMFLMSKTRKFGFATYRLDEKYKIKDEPSLEEKRIKELENQIRKYQSRQPSLTIAFESSKNTYHYINTDCNAAIAEIESKKQEKLLRARNVRFPQMKFGHPELDRIIAAASQFSEHSEANIESHKREIAKYIEDVSSIAEKMKSEIERCARSFEFGLKLINNGSAPANNIKIHLHFPDGFEMGEIKNRPQFGWPDFPEQPLSNFDRMMQRMQPPLFERGHIFDSPNLPPSNVHGKKILKTNSYDVSAQISNIQHHSDIKFHELYCEFPSINAMHSFTIEYSVICDELPDAVTGTLHAIYNN